MEGESPTQASTSAGAVFLSYASEDAGPPSGSQQPCAQRELRSGSTARNCAAETSGIAGSENRFTSVGCSCPLSRPTRKLGSRATSGASGSSRSIGRTTYRSGWHSSFRWSSTPRQNRRQTFQMLFAAFSGRACPQVARPRRLRSGYGGGCRLKVHLREQWQRQCHLASLDRSQAGPSLHPGGSNPRCGPWVSCSPWPTRVSRCWPRSARRRSGAVLAQTSAPRQRLGRPVVFSSALANSAGGRAPLSTWLG